MTQFYKIITKYLWKMAYFYLEFIHVPLKSARYLLTIGSIFVENGDINLLHNPKKHPQISPQASQAAPRSGWVWPRAALWPAWTPNAPISSTGKTTATSPSTQRTDTPSMSLPDTTVSVSALSAGIRSSRRIVDWLSWLCVSVWPGVRLELG